jgi:hypothetical protein
MIEMTLKADDFKGLCVLIEGLYNDMTGVVLSTDEPHVLPVTTPAPVKGKPGRPKKDKPDVPAFVEERKAEPTIQEAAMDLAPPVPPAPADPMEVKPATIEQARAVMTQYMNKFGLPASCTFIEKHTGKQKLSDSAKDPNAPVVFGALILAAEEAMKA